MQPDGADGRAGPRRPVRALPGPRPGPAWGPQRLPRPRPLRRRQRQPGAVLRAHRRPGPAPAHEGDRPARPAPARGRGPGPPAAFQPQGAGRERHDRRSPAERRGPRRRDGQRRRARVVHRGALRDGAPAHLGRHRAPAARDRAGRAVPGALPVRFGHRSTQGELHGRHPLAGTGAPWRLLRRDRSRRPARARRSGPASPWPSGPPWSTRDSGEAVYGTGGGITWDSEPAAEHAEVLAKAAVLSAPVREFELLETMRYDPHQGLRNRDRHLRRVAESAEYLGFRFDLPTALDTLRSRLSGRDAARVRLRLSRTGAMAVDVEALPAILAGPVLLALDDEPVDPFERWLHHKTTFREPYDRRRLRRPDVDDVIMVNTRGELTEVTRATLAVEVDGTWCTPPLASGCLPGVERARLLDLGVLHERVLRRADLDTARGLAVISSLRGWRDARLRATRRWRRRGGGGRRRRPPGAPGSRRDSGARSGGRRAAALLSRHPARGRPPRAERGADRRGPDRSQPRPRARPGRPRWRLRRARRPPGGR